MDKMRRRLQAKRGVGCRKRERRAAWEGSLLPPAQKGGKAGCLFWEGVPFPPGNDDARRFGGVRSGSGQGGLEASKEELVSSK